MEIFFYFTNDLLHHNIRHVYMIIHCGHHKCGSALFGTIIQKICEHMNLSFCGAKGPAKKAIYEYYDVVNFANSTIEFVKLNRPYTGTHMIRDPRDVIISGYLYHAHCKEKWCRNVPDITIRPIEFPQIPRSQYSRSGKWRKEYIQSLNGCSYQDNINNRNQNDGILFEMNHYGRWTIESMLDWDYDNPHIMEIKFEDVMRDFMGSFEKIFSHYEFSEQISCELLKLIGNENINNISDKEIQESDHIHSRQTSKWQKYFSSEHKALFKDMFGDVLINLGYENNNNW